MTTAILEACIVAAVWIASVVGVGIAAIMFGHDGLTLAVSIVVGAGVATGQIRSAIAQAELKSEAKLIKSEAKLGTKQNVEIQAAVEEVRKIANGNSDNRAAEARAAGSAETKAEVLAAVAAVVPEVVPTIVAKLPRSTKEQEYQRGVEDTMRDSKF